MSDNRGNHLDFLKSPAGAKGHSNWANGDTPNADNELVEDSCPAFGYVRGVRDRAVTLQLRYRNGNSDFFPYSWLGPIRFNPSVGLLLKFTGDVVTLVLIRGSNLDVLVNESVNLTDRGLARHRIVWVREMDEDELRRATQGEPTIDHINVVEFESQTEIKAWLAEHASVFVP